MPPIKVFISYAHEDIQAKERLAVQLVPMKREGLIEVWHDGKIQAGDEWDDEIKNNLEAAQLIILLLSPYFSASSYIFTDELPLVLEKQSQGLVEVIPILISDMNLPQDIGHLQCIPQNKERRLEAIELWESPNSAWKVVDRSIRSVIKGFNIEPSETNQEEKETPSFQLGDYHKYTCNRNKQRTQFLKIFQARKTQKVHYFYLYGQDVQSHWGMFQRIAYEKRSLLLNYLNPDLKPACQVIEKEITTEFSEDETIYKQNIIKSIFAAFKVSLHEEEPILEKDVNVLLQRSPKLQSLCQEDFISIMLSISEWDWDKEVTPNIIGWLLDHFFEVPLAADQPNILLFFSLIYEENDFEIEQEIVESIQSGTHDITILPELEQVEKRDIARWFHKYKKLFDSPSKLKEMRDHLFPEQEGVDMEEVEQRLEKVIGNYNKKKQKK